MFRRASTRRAALVGALALVAAACTSAADTTTTTATTTTAEAGATTTTEAGATTTTEAGATTTAADEPSESFLRVWSSQEFEAVFHPVQACCAQEIVLEMIFSSLLGVEQDSQTLQPELAVEWDASPDATVFTFTLAEGVTWHDGTPFTVDDVIWTATWTVANLEAYGAFTPVWSEIIGADAVTDGTADTLAGIEAVDDRTIRIELGAPNAEFLFKLAEPPNMIMPQHLLADETAATIRQSEFVTNSPVGTGPYRLVDFRSDQFVELEAVENYFDGAPQIDRIFYMLFGTEAALGALETGELDLALNLDPREKERLEGIDGLVVDSIQTPGIVRMELKNEAPPFNDARIRQAAYFAIDRRSICEQVLDGLCTILHINPGFMQYEGLNDYPFDPGRAQELLEEAGYDDTLVRIMWDSGVEAYNTIFPIIGQQLEDVGFIVEVQPTETSLFIDRLRFERDTWESYINTGGTELISPDRSAVYFNCTYEGERGKWQTGYENCEMDQLFVDGRQTGDPEARDVIYQQIADFLTLDVPAIHLWAPHNVFAGTERLGGGFGIAPNDNDSFNNVETWTLAG